MARDNLARLPGIDDGMPEPAPKRTKQTKFYVCHQQNNVVINQRRSDNYIDATAMCRAHGKLFGNWRQLEGTAELLAAAETIIGYPIMILVQSQVGGHSSATGTWIHPDLAIPLAQWCSPPFALLVSRWVREWVPPAEFAAAKAIDPFVIGPMLQALQGLNDRLPEQSEPIDVDALAAKVAAAVVAATRDDFRRVEGVVRSELEKQIKSVGIDVNCSHSILVGMQTDLWGYFKLDPAALQKLQQKHERDREAKKARSGEYVDPKTGEIKSIPQLVDARPLPPREE